MYEEEYDKELVKEILSQILSALDTIIYRFTPVKTKYHCFDEQL